LYDKSDEEEKELKEIIEHISILYITHEFVRKNLNSIKY
jgi:hypothetical protein